MKKFKQQILGVNFQTTKNMDNEDCLYSGYYGGQFYMIKDTKANRKTLIKRFRKLICNLKQ